jgi:hypothetical protein
VNAVAAIDFNGIGSNGSMPYSEDCEKGLLGSILKSPIEVLEKCHDQLSADTFYIPAHQIIYNLVNELVDADIPIDFVSLKQALKDRNQLEEIGGPEFLSSLYAFVPSSANAAYYIEIVREKYLLRQLILTCKKLVSQCNDPGEELEDVLREAANFDAIVRAGDKRSSQIVRVADLIAFKRDEDGNAVLGDRWLCRGDSLLISGPTGIGKSVFAMQAIIHWALGRSFFGIKTKEPQRILCVQSENNYGDLAISFQDVCDHLGISEQDEAALDQRIIFVRESERTGAEFIRYAKDLIRRHKPTVVLVDPLLSYVGGSVNDQAVMSAFLRNGIQPILDETGIIWVFVHHTGKPPRDQKSKPAGAEAYTALGSSEILNWARECLTFTVRDWDSRAFNLEFRKRARQSGIVTPDGAPTYELVLRHSEKGVVWESCSQDEIEETAPADSHRKTKCSADKLACLLSESESLNFTGFLHRASTVLGVSKATFARHLKTALERKVIRLSPVSETYERV